jgi:epoxyqueuosine reductase
MVTDLPLAPTKPIDAGMFKFCRTCLKCYDACGFGAPNDQTEPQWEPEGRFAGLYHNVGQRAYWDDQILCLSWKATPGHCSNGRCFGACPFSKNAEAAIHPVVQGTVATTSIFNGFFRNMDDVMGYGPGPIPDGASDPQQSNFWGASNKRAEKIWDHPMPLYGIDSTVAIS